MKILACDYDGTLNYGGMGEEKLAAIRKWREAGNKLGVVSGRGPSLAEFLKNEYDLSLDFYVFFNGGLILDSEQKEMYKVSCNTVEIADLVQDLFDWGCDFVHVNSDRYYLIRREETGLREDAYLLKDISFPPLLCQVSVQLKTAEEAAEIVKPIAAKYGRYIVPLQNATCIDIVPKGVNKASGIYKLMELYNVEYRDVITVGDNLNDTDMIREFTSYAMENGAEEIKRLADHRTKSVIDLIEKEMYEKF